MNVAQRLKTGAPCKALASKEGLCAIHAEPSRAADLGRRSGKARRYIVESADKPVLLPAPQTAQDVRKALGEVMSNLRGRRLDPRVASAVAYDGNVMLRAIEVGDLEERMAKLEALRTTTE